MGGTPGVGSGWSVLPLSDQVDACPLPSGLHHRRYRLCPLGGRVGREATFGRFVRRSGSGEIVGVYWKMSTDLSRPLVAATGLHDALDGFITFREAQNAAKTADVEATDLSAAIE